MSLMPNIMKQPGQLYLNLLLICRATLKIKMNFESSLDTELLAFSQDEKSFYNICFLLVKQISPQVASHESSCFKYLLLWQIAMPKANPGEPRQREKIDRSVT